jgi:hypothetical protein
MRGGWVGGGEQGRGIRVEGAGLAGNTREQFKHWHAVYTRVWGNIATRAHTHWRNHFKVRPENANTHPGYLRPGCVFIRRRERYEQVHADACWRNNVTPVAPTRTRTLAICGRGACPYAGAKDTNRYTPTHAGETMSRPWPQHEHAPRLFVAGVRVGIKGLGPQWPRNYKRCARARRAWPEKRGNDLKKHAVYTSV